MKKSKRKAIRILFILLFLIFILIVTEVIIVSNLNLINLKKSMALSNENINIFNSETEFVHLTVESIDLNVNSGSESGLISSDSGETISSSSSSSSSLSNSRPSPSSNLIHTLALNQLNSIFEDFEGTTDWIVGGSGLGKFEIGIPTSFETNDRCKTFCLGTGISTDHSEIGTNAACTNLNGYLQQFEDSFSNFLESPIYDFSGLNNINLELWRFMEIEGNDYDYCYFEYKDSISGNWKNFEIFGENEIDDNDWVQYKKNLDTIASNKEYFQLRFYCSTDDWTEGSGLCIDDIKLYWGDSFECGNGVLEGSEQCDDGNKVDSDGCSASCEKEKHYFVVPYVGDISASFSSDWYFFYDQITDFHEDNKMPAGFSFYPRDVSTVARFVDPFKKMYESNNVELVQKGFLVDSLTDLSELSYQEQKDFIKEDREFYMQQMQDILGTNSINLPTTYNQFHGTVTSITQQAMIDLGFLMYFDVFVEEGFTALESTETFDTIQYGVSFTENGDSGAETVFKTKDNIIDQIKNYDLSDPVILYINGDPVIPLWLHQHDFMDKNVDNKVDQEKWDIYTDTLKTLNKDPEFTLLKPEDVYEFRHSPIVAICGNEILEENEQCDDGNLVDGDGCDDKCIIEIIEPICGNGELEVGEQCDDGNLVDGDECSASCEIEIPNGNEICQYAISASANSENSQSLASFAIGSPNAPEHICNEFNGYGYAWSPENWDVKAKITLEFEKPILASNLTVFGYYDMCWDNIWLLNSITGDTKLVFEGFEESCVYTTDLSGDFIADSVILESCGWSWSYTDTVEICGKI